IAGRVDDPEARAWAAYLLDPGAYDVALIGPGPVLGEALDDLVEFWDSDNRDKFLLIGDIELPTWVTVDVAAVKVVGGILNPFNLVTWRSGLRAGTCLDPAERQRYLGEAPGESTRAAEACKASDASPIPAPPPAPPPQPPPSASHSASATPPVPVNAKKP